LIDIKIIEECRGGNFNNFRKLVELTSPYAFSLAFRMLGDEELAKDVTQETMITIWQKLNKIKSAEVYRSWIYKVVINKCYDHLRNRKRKEILKYLEHEIDMLILDEIQTVDNHETQISQAIHKIRAKKKI